jgi:L-asparagine transporter-like permease
MSLSWRISWFTVCVIAVLALATRLSSPGELTQEEFWVLVIVVTCLFGCLIALGILILRRPTPTQPGRHGQELQSLAEQLWQRFKHKDR